MWLTKGRIFIGDFKSNYMNEGKLYQLQSDNTFELYKVKYEPQ